MSKNPGKGGSKVPRGGRAGKAPKGDAGKRPFGKKPNASGYGLGDKKRPPKEPGKR